MSDLVVVGYADRDRAGSVLHALRTLDSTWADRNDMVAVARDRKGNLRIAERGQIVTGRAVAWSTLWLGLVHSAAAPDAGAPIVVARHAGSVGLPERFVRAVGQMVERGNSAIII